MNEIEEVLRQDASRLPVEVPAALQEKLAERFHMDIDLREELNPGAQFIPGEEIEVAAYGPDREGAESRG